VTNSPAYYCKEFLTSVKGFIALLLKEKLTFLLHALNRKKQKGVGSKKKYFLLMIYCFVLFKTQKRLEITDRKCILNEQKAIGPIIFVIGNCDIFMK
jgi:hypothetical protein